MTEATYEYIESGLPNVEILNCTTAPTNGQTVTCKKLNNPLLIGTAWTEAAAAADSLSGVTSGVVTTLTVIGTARTCTLTFVEKSPI